MAGIMKLERGMVISVSLDPVKGSETGKTRPCVIVTNDVYNERVSVIQVVPLTAWSKKKTQIITNVEIEPTKTNGLTKRSIADCLQTRPINRNLRIEKVLGRLSLDKIKSIDHALKILFDLT